MKKIYFLFLLTILPLVASADPVAINGIYYNLDASKKVAEVTTHPDGYTGKVVIPKTVTYNSVKYSVKSIADRVFAGCEGLTSVTIPNSISSIKEYTFSGCSGLTSVTIGKGVTSIERGAFDGCNALTSVHISDLAAWCRICWNCRPLYKAHHLYLNDTEIKDLEIPNSVTSINKVAFAGCTGLTSVTIPNSVTSIGDNAFEACSGLTSATISNSVTSIGDAVFSGCTSLTSINIPNGVTTIGANAFYGCGGLTSVTIPNSVTSIGQMAFAYCRSLTSVNIPNSVTVIYQSAFCECTGLTSVHITDLSAWCKINFYTSDSNPLTFAHHLFLNGTEIKKLVIPDDITEISPHTFCCGSSLTSVTIPNSVTSIGDFAFYCCSSLPSVTIPKSVTSIGYCAFAGCSSFSSVTIPNSVTYIGSFAFQNCSKLSSLIIGTGIHSITSYAFSGCPILTDVSCYAENVPNTDYRAFYDSNIENATLHVPVGSLEAYKAADPWSQFGSKVKITSKVKLNKSEVEIERGKTVTLKATVTPSTLLDKSVTWKSSNTKVATVTSSGKVKGIKGGTATITCTSKVSGAKATCKVTVINGTVTLNKTEAYLEKGKTMTLKATLTPTDLEDKSVTWTSSDTKIATVSSSGKVKGVKYGTATITCTSNATGVSATCKVTVGKVVISMSEFSIKKSRAITLEAAVYPSTLADRSVVWESSDSKIATVSSSGRVKGVKAGTATITCTSVATGLSAICTVTVLSTSETRSTDGDDDGTTGIEMMEDRSAVAEPYDVYDMSGRKVRHQVTSLDGLPNGIYIVNGKKILKK